MSSSIAQQPPGSFTQAAAPALPISSSMATGTLKADVADGADAKIADSAAALAVAVGSGAKKASFPLGRVAPLDLDQVRNHKLHGRSNHQAGIHSDHRFLASVGSRID
jgi:hypothetical protein